MRGGSDMGIFMELALMGAEAIPDPEKPITYESFIEQYKDSAINAMKEKGWDETNWKVLAEIWAEEDIENLRIVMTQNPGKSTKELLVAMFSDKVQL
jgi:hypothetical protein